MGSACITGISPLTPEAKPLGLQRTEKESSLVRQKKLHPGLLSNFIGLCYNEQGLFCITVRLCFGDLKPVITESTVAVTQERANKHAI